MKFAGNVAMRSEFEKLHEILELMQYVTCFDGLRYISDNQRTADYLNGAWMAYQEQQKDIDSMKSKIQDIWTSLDDRQSKEHIIESCESIIQELLK